jgi:hypothetical protein
LGRTEVNNETTLCLLQLGTQEKAKRFKELEKENIRLKGLVADLSLDKAILKDAASGNL